MLDLWIDDLKDNRWVVAAIVLAAVGIPLYIFGGISERTAGLLLAAVVLLGVGGYATVRFVFEDAETRWRVAGVGVSLIAALMAGLLIVPTLLPGQPLASGELSKEGDTLSLPKDAPSSLRLLLHASVRGLGRSEVVLAVDGLRVESHFSRDNQKVRVGRRGRGNVMTDHNSEFVSARLSHPAHRIQLQSLTGELNGPLVVQVFRDVIPMGVALGAAILLFLLATLVAARHSELTAAAGALGALLIFAIMTHEMATPDAAVRPEFGALILGVVVSGLAAGLFSWILRRLFWRHGAVPARP